VVVKSTVIPGTTDGAVRRAVESASGKAAGAGFGLGMNPEFLTEGTAVRDFMRPDRLVLGGIDGRTQDALAALYAAFDPDVPRIRCNNATAEMIKYASNSVLATLISFSNEVARLCDAVGNVDVADVMRGVHASAYLTTRRDGEDPVRAGIASFLEAGCGFGGSCLPKDVTALTAQGRELGLDMPLLRSVLEINRTQPEELIRLAGRHFPDLRGRKITVLGLAFKPDTDDVRESPALDVAAAIGRRGGHVVVYDPQAMDNARKQQPDLKYADALADAAAGADLVMLLTEWAEFKAIQPAALAELVARRNIVDGRNVLDPRQWRAAGWRYRALGRP
jgi:UDPglucose 6-dehydrogenase/GDP-mannose 6-dehydrogenase